MRKSGQRTGAEGGVDSADEEEGEGGTGAEMEGVERGRERSRRRRPKRCSHSGPDR